jgi:acyl-CoA dehydrogenase
VSVFETPERRALRETVRRFVTHDVLPYQDDWEAAGELPRSLHARAAELGLIGLAYPESVGGGGGDAVDALVLAEEMHYAGGAGGLFASLFTSGISLPHLVNVGTQEQIERWVRPTIQGRLIGSLAITEPDGGSDVAGIRTTAKLDGDEYVVSGAKTYITSGVRADFVVIAVRTGGPGAHGISLLVIEKGTPGFTVSRKLAKMGWLCSDTAELSFQDVRVPASNLVGEENTGFVQIAQNFVSERIGLPVARDVRPPAHQPAAGAEHAGGDGAARRGRAGLHTLGRGTKRGGGSEPRQRGVLREEHRGGGGYVGGRSGGSAARRDGIHARV